MNRTNDYGWASGGGPKSCEYIIPAVLNVLHRLRPRRVLDLGAGNGALCRVLVAEGYDVAGVEPDPNGVQIARRECPTVRFYQLGVDDAADVLRGDYPDGFDIVVSTEVIEHLYAPRQLVAFARSLLRSHGSLVLTTPYHGYFKNLAISVANMWDTHADPLWEGGHIKFFSRNTIARLLQEGGFRITQFGGVGRLPYLWKSMLVVAEKVRMQD